MRNSLLFGIMIGVVISVIHCEVSPDQQQQLINAHNKYRRDVAQGKISGQPAAANMLELVCKFLPYF